MKSAYISEYRNKTFINFAFRHKQEYVNIRGELVTSNRILINCSYNVIDDNIDELLQNITTGTSISVKGYPKLKKYDNKDFYIINLAVYSFEIIHDEIN